MNRLNAGADILRSKICRESVLNGRRRGKAGWFLALALLAAVARAADPLVSVAPPSAWVSPLPFQRLTKPEDLKSGRESRLLLRDVQINARDQATFLHEARQLLTSAGVQDGSRITVDFNPSRQSLILHWVRIWRGTNSFNELDPEKVKIIQPERNLEQSLFTGEKTALLFLEAVQTGDIVEFACTVRGANPSGGAKMSGGVLVREYEPVERLATRLLWPRDRRIYFKNHGTDAQPLIARKDDLRAYTWDFKKAPEVQREEPLPPGYNPLPWVQWSEYQEWSQVSQWEMTIFTNGTALSPELARQIKEWRRLPGAEAQVRAVLRFLQEEVRYQGIETGAEYYQIANIWNPVPTGPGYVCRFYSYNVDRAVQKPTVSFRSMPLGLSHPGHEVFRAEIALPPFVNVDPGSWAINNPAFHFHKTVISSARKVLLEQEYDSLSDAVPVEGMAGYLEQLDQVFSLLGYSIFSY